MSSQHTFNPSKSPFNPSPLSPNRQGQSSGSNPFPTPVLARTGSSSGRSIGEASAGSHSRDSSFGQSVHTHYLHKQPSQQSLTAAAATAAATPGMAQPMTPFANGATSPSATSNGRYTAAGQSTRGSQFPLGKAASPTPSRSSFGANSSADASSAASLGSAGHAANGTGYATSGFMARPSLRETLSDGIPAAPTQASASDQRGTYTPSLYSSASGNGSMSNLSSNLCAPSLTHSASNSSLHSPVGSIASPQYGVPSNELFGLQRQQLSPSASASTPPIHGPLSSSDPRTSLLVLNLPYKVRWQDLKDLFRRSNGTVLRADVSLNADGMSRGFGSVLMRDAEDAKRARECFNGFEWMGRRLDVMIERGGGGGWESASSSTSNLLAHQQQAAKPASPKTAALSVQHLSQQGNQLLPAMQSVHRSSSFGAGDGGSQVHPSPSAAPLLQTQSSSSLAPQHRASFGHQQEPFAQRQNPATGIYNSQSGGLLAPPQTGTPFQTLSPTPNHQSPLPPHPSQQLRTASFSSSSSNGTRRPSSHQLAGRSAGTPNFDYKVVNARSNSSSSGLPAPPFPPPAPSPSAATALAPGAIPTQHQLAVLSAQAAQAAVAVQQAQVVAQNGGLPQGSYYGRTLFVGNLSYATQWQDLKDLFRAAGNIVRADIALGAEGRSRGFGTALFASKEEAARAVRMFHGYDHNGRALKVHFDRFARMECPPPGMLVPARVEDYTAAFNAAQPPSNVSGTSSGPTQQRMPTAGGSGMPSAQQPYNYQSGLMPGFAGNGPHGFMASPSHVMPQAPGQMLGAGLQYGRGSVSNASSPYGYQSQGPIQGHVPSPAQPYQQQQAQQLQTFGGHSLSHQQPAQMTQQPSQAGSAGQESNVSSRDSSSSQNIGVPAGPAQQSSDNAQEQSSEEKEASKASAAAPPAGSTRGASSGVRPGRIALPSPPRIPQTFNPQQPYPLHAYNGAVFSTGPAGPQGRAPMPMTPGVPLTPGFAMGAIPPPTPPAFHQPFMSPGSAMMSPAIAGYDGHAGMRMMPTTPGAAGPPTPWQFPGMNAAPGAPFRPPPGQMTPRGGPTAGHAFNPFFAAAAGYQGGYMPQTPHWNANPTPARGSQRRSDGRSESATVASKAAPAPAPEQTDSNRAPSSSAHDESALSSRSASPSVAPLPSQEEGYPFPAVQTKGDEEKDAAPVASQEDASGNVQKSVAPASQGATAGTPFSLLTRRASTNSPAVSPGIFGSLGGVANGIGESNTSFGYFGAALANAVQKNGDVQSKERRPSLGADDLRTPAREHLGGGGSTGYFPTVSDSTSATDSSDGNLQQAPGASANGHTPGSGSNAAGVPSIAIGKGHQSTEEMARAIAKMSIQGTAMKRTGSQRSQRGHTQAQE